MESFCCRRVGRVVVRATTNREREAPPSTTQKTARDQSDHGSHTSQELIVTTTELDSSLGIFHRTPDTIECAPDDSLFEGMSIAPEMAFFDLYAAVGKSKTDEHRAHWFFGCAT